MIKRAVVCGMVLLLMATSLYAQGARDTSPLTIGDARTNFTAIGLTGLNTTGNPGYLVMTGQPGGSSDATQEWYFWVNPAGTFCMASFLRLSGSSTVGSQTRYASFPNGNWDEEFMPNTCSAVGDQIGPNSTRTAGEVQDPVL